MRVVGWDSVTVREACIQVRSSKVFAASASGVGINLARHERLGGETGHSSDLCEKGKTQKHGCLI